MTLMHKAMKEEQRHKILMQKKAHGDKIRSDVGYAKDEKRH